MSTPWNVELDARDLSNPTTKNPYTCIGTATNPVHAKDTIALTIPVAQQDNYDFKTDNNRLDIDSDITVVSGGITPAVALGYLTGKQPSVSDGGHYTMNITIADVVTTCDLHFKVRVRAKKEGLQPGIPAGGHFEVDPGISIGGILNK